MVSWCCLACTLRNTVPRDAARAGDRDGVQMVSWCCLACTLRNTVPRDAALVCEVCATRHTGRVEDSGAVREAPPDTAATLPASLPPSQHSHLSLSAPVQRDALGDPILRSRSPHSIEDGAATPLQERGGVAAQTQDRGVGKGKGKGK